MPRLTRLFFAVLSVLFVCTVPAQAQPKYVFKVASLAPDGSVWVKEFREFASEVTAKTNGDVVFRIYPGGIMGDDQAMYWKLRVGQLQGGGFTVTGVADVVPDFRVMAIPFLFRSYKEVDAVRAGLVPYFKKKFKQSGLEFIAMTEVGFVYAMSTKPIRTLADLQNSKCWAPPGDPLTGTYLGDLHITPIPLSIPDVLTSLDTGMVNTVFNSLYGSIVLQWYTRARYITDVPFGYAYGVFLLDGKAFSRLPPQYARVIHTTADKYFKALIKDTRKSNRESRQVLKQNGVTFVQPESGVIKKLEQKRDQTVKKITGSAFSTTVYNMAEKILKDYRAAHPDEASDANRAQTDK